MKGPIARPVTPAGAPHPTAETVEARAPRAFAPVEVQSIETVEPSFDTPDPEAALVAPPLPKQRSWAGRIAWGAGGVLVSLGLSLAAERLISDLFARYQWLGWVGIAALIALVTALIFVAMREIVSVRKLARLDSLREQAGLVLISDDPVKGRAVLVALQQLYAARPDLARPRATLDANSGSLFDGAEMVRFSERTLMSPLDARARAMTAAAARRVALVTAVSPRALIDIAFVVYESVRLGGAIATLYGARPGFFGFWRLAGAILGHLAVTGGLVLTDGLIEQLVGQGLAAKLSARLGEGVVNGLMTVRVGIAAMRVVRPLPFDVQPKPVVKDFIGDLANLVATAPRS